MSIDPDREVEEFVDKMIAIGAGAWHKMETHAQKRKALKPARTFQEMYGGRAVLAADIARDRSTSPDPTARDLVAWEAFAVSESRWVSFAPGAAELSGAPTRKKALARANGFRLLRRAYEAETGFSALNGSKLTAGQRATRVNGLRPEWIEEARLLRDNYVDSKAGQNIRKLIEITRETSERRLASRVIRKTPAQMCL
ncbi:hypothetical protein [Paracoccus beibuensis]|uniref:hypothetical protein n=1 Tax=Paracoccus beibuensis TaxID=547602 RepID=UPI00223FB2EB|nr:hypothetical protein [Paracoccus beibuensis]